MTGCIQGFSTRLQQASASSTFYRVWCLAHQLDLATKSAIAAISDLAKFDFMETLTRTIAWLRRQDTLIRRMKSKCPYYINVRWTSLAKVLRWLIKNKSHVVGYFYEKSYTSAPTNTWWLLTFVLHYYFEPVLTTFNLLQEDSAVIDRQYDYLKQLMRNLRQQISSVRDEVGDPKSKVVDFDGETFQCGQFIVNHTGLSVLCKGISVEASELEELLTDSERSVLFLVHCCCLPCNTQ